MKGFVIFIIIVILLVIGFAWLGNKNEATPGENTTPAPTNDELGLPMAPVAPTAAVPTETLPAASAGIDAEVIVDAPTQ